MVSFKSLSDYNDVDGRIKSAQDSADSAKNGLGTLTNSLKNLAYKSLVEQAMKEEGLISGAFLKMSLIDVKNVVAQGISAQKIDAGNATIKNLNVDTVKMTNADVTGSITATSGSIGMFSINKLFGLSSASSTSSLDLHADGISFRGSGANAGSNVRLGPNSADYPWTEDILCPSIFEVTRVGSASTRGNAGLYISVSGITGFNNSEPAYGNSALFIPQGHITGLRYNVRRLSSNTTLTTIDSYLILTNNSGRIIITLPYGCEDGQTYQLKSSHFVNGDYAIALEQNHGTSMYWAGNSTTTSLNVNDGKTYTVVYDAYNNQWSLTISGY